MTINLEDLTLKQIRELAALTAGLHAGMSLSPPTPEPYPFASGAIVCVETIMPTFVGILEYVTATTIVLRDASWIPSTGRYSAFASGAEPEEVEPLPVGFYAIERSSVI